MLPIRASRHKGMLRSAVPSAGDSDGMGTGDGHRDTVTGIEHPRWLHNAQLAALPACRCVRPSVRPSVHPPTHPLPIDTQRCSSMADCHPLLFFFPALLFCLSILSPWAGLCGPGGH